MKQWMNMCVVAVAAFVMVGCASPEEKAKDAISDYETNVFETCKTITAEGGGEPGSHYCSKVGSMALEMALQDSGLPEADWKKLVADWQKSAELGAYYVDETARDAMPK